MQVGIFSMGREGLWTFESDTVVHVIMNKIPISFYSLISVFKPYGPLGIHKNLVESSPHYCTSAIPP